MPSRKSLSRDEMWNEIMAGLRDNEESDEVVREAAAKYFNEPNHYYHDPISYLIDYHYKVEGTDGTKIGKKLVLFWDDFDESYDPRYRPKVNAVLRHQKEEVKRKRMWANNEAVGGSMSCTSWQIGWLSRRA